MIAFIDAHKDQYGIEPMCKQLPMAVSTYYAHKDRESDPDKESNRSIRDRHLKPEIQRVWDENMQVYGVKKVWRQLKREGFVIARCTVERLMKDLDIQGVTKGGAKCFTTIRDENRTSLLIWLIVSLSLTDLTGFGWLTLPLLLPGQALSMWPLSPMFSAVRLLAGVSVAR